MDIEDRHCQNDEEYQDCTTNDYLRKLRSYCGCFPLSLNIKNETICGSEALKCVKSINIEGHQCLQPCSGLSLTGYFKSVEFKDFEHLIPKTFQSYKEYKTWITFPPTLKGRHRKLWPSLYNSSLIMDVSFEELCYQTRLLQSGADVHNK